MTTTDVAYVSRPSDSGALRNQRHHNCSNHGACVSRPSDSGALRNTWPLGLPPNSSTTFLGPQIRALFGTTAVTTGPSDAHGF